jgi:hypothetical protein
MSIFGIVSDEGGRSIASSIFSDLTHRLGVLQNHIASKRGSVSFFRFGEPNQQNYSHRAKGACECKSSWM